MGVCSSDTLGLSNTLSEVVESVAMAVSDPYEVISSEDMLARIQSCNREINKLRDENKKVAGAGCGKDELGQAQLDKNTENAEWDWRAEYILLGSDVTALFPSLSASNTAKSVRRQIEKSKIEWRNIYNKWLTLYLKLNDNNLKQA